MEGFVMTAQIILSLSILVGLHEAGHLLAAKFFGMRVEQFSIGFPPKIFSFKWGETEYALSAIPLGGFVKISGMIDESLDTEAMKEEPKEYEFRAKPAWQRLIVMLGGIIVNVITGIIIFISLTYVFGDYYIPKDTVNEKGGIVAYELAQELGFKTGDRIIKVNGQDFDDFQDILEPSLFLADDAYYTVDRDGEIVDIPIPTNFIDNLNDEKAMASFIFPRYESKIGKIGENTLAERIGLQVGDRIVEISGTPVQYQDQVREKLSNYDNDSIHLKVLRDDDLLSFNENFRQDTVLGYWPEGVEMSQITYDLGTSIAKGTTEAFGIVFLQIKAFGKMFKGELSFTKNLSGPIGIAKAYGGNWDWQRFWRMTGLLSMVLAFMNLLPIPALDGGHVTFLSYEIISGRKPSDGFLETAQKIGMAFLLLLMVFIFGNDIFKVFFQ
ncbi:MAG: RIP metalloprotease RseP [Bacteroidota bacterium]